jgi:RNA polymerase sigma factor (sigma-70 family)
MRQAREEKQLEALLERYERPLVSYAHRILGDLESARDVVQETFLKWIETQPPYPMGEKSAVEGGGRLEAWLFTVCRNRAIDLQRRQSRIVPLKFGEEEGGWDLEARETGPDADAERRELAEELAHYVDQLPASQREVVHLKFQMDRSYKEISELTGLSVGNVGFLLHRALRKLRETVGARWVVGERRQRGDRPA